MSPECFEILLGGVNEINSKLTRIQQIYKTALKGIYLYGAVLTPDLDTAFDALPLHINNNNNHRARMLISLYFTYRLL